MILLMKCRGAFCCAALAARLDVAPDGQPLMDSPIFRIARSKGWRCIELPKAPGQTVDEWDWCCPEHAG